ncbi:MAG: hypothetical protein HYX92_21595 [Chloroflexi bacterium]|nr:hypothetical protein [Chloroflexota bacterium]
MSGPTGVKQVRIRRSFVPVLLPENASVRREAKLAERLPSLDGATVGFYNNRKAFAANALPAVDKVLKERGVRETFVAWGTSSNRPSDEMLSSLAQADAVVLAGAD